MRNNLRKMADERRTLQDSLYPCAITDVNDPALKRKA